MKRNMGIADRIIGVCPLYLPFGISTKRKA